MTSRLRSSGRWAGIGAAAAVLALVPLWVSALIVPIAAAVALALAFPVFGVAWVVLSVPVQETLELPVSLTQMAVVLALGVWGLRVLAYPERRIGYGRLLPFWASLLLVLAFASSLSVFSVPNALRETARWGVAALIWLLTINTIQSRRDLYGIAACLLLAPLACALIGLWQFAAGEGPPSFRVNPDGIFVRAYGTIGQPNSFAGYMNMAWPLACACSVGAGVAAWRNRAQPQRTWWVAVVLSLSTILLLGGLVASFSRGAWIGAACGALAMILALGGRFTRLGVAFLIGGVLILGLGGTNLLPEPVAARMESITRNLRIFDAASVAVTPENFAVVERMAHLQAGTRMFTAFPLHGVGPGNYSLAYPEFAVGSWYASRGHAHNYYLNMAAEAGIFGLAAYLALMGAASLLAVRCVRRARDLAARSLAIGCCGMMAAVLGHNLFENLHVLNLGIHLAAAWGLLEVLQKDDSCVTS